VDARTLSKEDQAYVFKRARFPALKRIYHRLRRSDTFESLLVRSGLKDGALKALGYQPITEYDNAASEAWRVMAALIDEWISRHPKPAVLMPIPLSHHVYGLANPRAYQERLRTAATTAGGAFFDPLPQLLARPLTERKTYYFPGDGHLTKAGHEALAGVMAPFIEARLARAGKP
jgi:hypothetical protein